MVTTFENAKANDKVWDIRLGWGKVYHMRGLHNVYPVEVLFPRGGRLLYTVDGLYHKDDLTQSLFWDEVVIEAPVKPLPDLDVDTKVLVWNDYLLKTRRHFSHFSPSGKIVCFSNGATSWTTEQTSEWDSWELAE